LELTIRRLAAKAAKGDVASATSLLKSRTHAKKHGDSGPIIITVSGGSFSVSGSKSHGGAGLRQNPLRQENQ
jgi:hypothetical protein